MSHHEGSDIYAPTQSGELTRGTIAKIAEPDEMIDPDSEATKTQDWAWVVYTAGDRERFSDKHAIATLVGPEEALTQAARGDIRLIG